jgi:hypothetical protein
MPPGSGSRKTKVTDEGKRKREGRGAITDEDGRCRGRG